jgi:hypothetical protein
MRGLGWERRWRGARQLGRRLDGAAAGGTAHLADDYATGGACWCRLAAMAMATATAGGHDIGSGCPRSGDAGRSESDGESDGESDDETDDDRC